MSKADEIEDKITLEDYILTNLNLKEGCFNIRLKDNKEYIVYHRKPRGQKTIYYIKYAKI